MISKGDLERCCSSVIKGSDATASAHWMGEGASHVGAVGVCGGELQIRGGREIRHLRRPLSLSKLRVFFTGECAGEKKLYGTPERVAGETLLTG